MVRPGFLDKRAKRPMNPCPGERGTVKKKVKKAGRWAWTRKTVAMNQR